MAYLVCFFAAVVCMYYAEVVTNRKLKKFLVITSAIILIMLAALRSEKVGHDVALYQKKLLLLSRHTDSFGSYIDKCIKIGTEILYCVIAYFPGRIGNGFFWTFFVYESVIVVFTYLSLWEFKEVAPPYLSLACFLCFYYLRGYDQTRQWMAISIVMFAVALMHKGKMFGAFFMVIVACGIHVSAIVGFGILLDYLIIKKTFKKLYLLIVAIGGAILSLFYRDIFIWFLKFVPFRASRYANLLLSSSKVENTRYIGIIYCSFALVVVLIKIKLRKGKDNTVYMFLVSMMILGIVGSLIQNSAGSIQRIFLYANIFIVLSIPIIPELFDLGKLGNLVVCVLVYSIMIAFWYVVFCKGNAGNVYPYMLAYREMIGGLVAI